MEVGGGWAEKISCTIRGKRIEKYLGEKIKIPKPHQPNNCERSLSSLLDDIMNKETFIRTVNPILFFFIFSMESQQGEEEQWEGKVLI